MLPGIGRPGQCRDNGLALAAFDKIGHALGRSAEGAGDGMAAALHLVTEVQHSLGSPGFTANACRA